GAPTMTTSTLRIFALVAASCLTACSANSAADDAQTESAATDVSPTRPTTSEGFDLQVEPGLSLQAKLDMPSGPTPAGGWPLIVMLEGSGTIDVDFTLLVPPTKAEDCVGAGPDGTRADGSHVDCYKIDQLYATQVASLGFAVARLGKRGVTDD